VNGTPTPKSSFAYWTGTYALDAYPNMPYSSAVPASGAPRTPPAPWVPFTRAGCDVGDVHSPFLFERDATFKAGDMTFTVHDGFAAGAEVHEIPQVRDRLAEMLKVEKHINLTRAKEILADLRKGPGTEPVMH